MPCYNSERARAHKMTGRKRAEISRNSKRTSAIARFVALKTSKGETPALVFVYEKEHGRELAAKISHAIGLRVPFICGDTPARDRDALARHLSACDPRYPVVVATDAWATGIDIPTIRAVFDVTGRKAPIPLNQRPGRGARLADEKCGCEFYLMQEVGLPRDRQAHYDAVAQEQMEGLRAAGQDVRGAWLEDRESEFDNDLDELLALGGMRQRKGRETPEDKTPIGLRMLDIASMESVIVFVLMLLLIIYGVGQCASVIGD